MSSKAWKMSSSVIIALRSPQIWDTARKVESFRKSNFEDNSNKFDNNLHLLSLRRGESDRLLPGMHVFPGGNLCESDTSPAWVELYQSFGYDESSFTSLSTGGGIELLPEYKGKDCAPGWMSLRVCAIRETFEESGILLCRSPIQAQQGLPFASFLILNELADWQKRVRGDPRQMLALCHVGGFVPDLWGLHLWSNWLTPTQQRVRHNSVFFLAVLNSLPPFSVDNLEMDELKCCKILDFIDDAHTGKIRLANPQYYEALRLCNFKDADSLASFASNRARLGCIRTMPVQQKTKDGMLYILPGDTAYPMNVDYETPSEFVKREETLLELKEKIEEQHGTLHRLEVTGGSICQKVITYNYIPPHQHVLPANINVRECKTESHL